MGVLSGITKKFNISEKRRLPDPLKITVNNTEVSKSIKSWIDQQPLTIFDMIYNKNTLALTRDAISYFKQVLQSKHPEYLEVIMLRKERRKALRHV